MPLKWMISALMLIVLIVCYPRFANDPLRGWELDSVMVLESNRTTAFNLDLPFRVLHGNNVALTRSSTDPAVPATATIRLDLTINGHPVTVYARVRE